MIAVSGGIFVVNILKHQHIPELFFSPFWEATAIDELRRTETGVRLRCPQFFRDGDRIRSGTTLTDADA